MKKEISPRPYQIKDLRKRHGITQQKLADSLYGVSVESVVNWENDRRNCPPIT